MAYRIEYEPEIRSPVRRNGIRFQALTAVFLFLFALMVVRVWPEGKQMLRQVFMPENGTAAHAAVTALFNNLHEGDSVGDALTTFCREIVSDALEGN